MLKNAITAGIVSMLLLPHAYASPSSVEAMAYTILPKIECLTENSPALRAHNGIDYYDVIFDNREHMRVSELPIPDSLKSLEPGQCAQGERMRDGWCTKLRCTTTN